MPDEAPRIQEQPFIAPQSEEDSDEDNVPLRPFRAQQQVRKVSAQVPIILKQSMKHFQTQNTEQVSEWGKYFNTQTTEATVHPAQERNESPGTNQSTMASALQSCEVAFNNLELVTEQDVQMPMILKNISTDSQQ